jgi:hypothetical protein
MRLAARFGGVAEQYGDSDLKAVGKTEPPCEILAFFSGEGKRDKPAYKAVYSQRGRGEGDILGYYAAVEQFRARGLGFAYRDDSVKTSSTHSYRQNGIPPPWSEKEFF